jgi:hypothetical protein
MSHGSAAVQDSQNNGTRRARLTIASGKVASDLTDMPVRVDLASITDLAWWALVKTDGGNIRVRNSSGTLIPFDVTRINKGAKTGELFFKSTILTGSSNLFFIDINDGLSLLANNDTNGRDNVWVDYALVTIPSADYAASLTVPVDRTGKGATFSIAAGAGTAPALTANGIYFANSGYVKAVGGGLGAGQTFTACCRKRQDVNDNSSDKVMMAVNHDSNSDAGGACLQSAQSVANNFRLHNTTDGNLNMSTTGVAARLNLWDRMTMTHDGTTARTIRRNGIEKTTDNTIGARPTTGGAVFFGARHTGATQPWRGDLDYAYLRYAVLSDNWLLGEAASWESPSTFYAIT